VTLLLLFLHLLPAVDQIIGNAVGYWVGLIPRIVVHFGVPLAWERSWKKAFVTPFKIEDRKKTLIWSVGGGAVAFGIIYLFYFLLQDQFDPELMRAEINNLYPVTPTMYVAVGLVISVVNPLLEEFYWRGFLYRKFAERGGGIWIGVLFALHHYIIFKTWFDPLTLSIALVGLAIVGVLFNWLYKKTGNVWACLITHAFADLAIILIGYQILFG
jgi:membrane protease YdiL (CAAX protease family)